MDFSEAAGRALEWAYRLAGDAEIRIIHAWQMPLSKGFTSTKMATKKEEQSRLQGQLRAHIDHVRQGVSIDFPAAPVIIIEGNPSHVISRGG
jgi:hypothetical protein